MTEPRALELRKSDGRKFDGEVEFKPKDGGKNTLSAGTYTVVTSFGGELRAKRSTVSTQFDLELIYSDKSRRKFTESPLITFETAVVPASIVFIGVKSSELNSEIKHHIENNDSEAFPLPDDNDQEILKLSDTRVQLDLFVYDEAGGPLNLNRILGVPEPESVPFTGANISSNFYFPQNVCVRLTLPSVENPNKTEKIFFCKSVKINRANESEIEWYWRPLNYLRKFENIDEKLCHYFFRPNIFQNVSDREEISNILANSSEFPNWPLIQAEFATIETPSGGDSGQLNGANLIPLPIRSAETGALTKVKKGAMARKSLLCQYSVLRYLSELDYLDVFKERSGQVSSSVQKESHWIAQNRLFELSSASILSTYFKASKRILLHAKTREHDTNSLTHGAAWKNVTFKLT